MVYSLPLTHPHTRTKGLADNLRSLGSIIANLLGGGVMDVFGPRALYGTSSACVACSLGLYLLATRCTSSSRAGQVCEPPTERCVPPPCPAVELAPALPDSRPGNCAAAVP
eukprot:CAMPEP_0179885214 /NCGR_PEP_ID=MMETSP0982-20121206/30145_1 /TAXON_ID=483367 /ORGANISM="non described non described, Strain CCMP 2436" /LENGTH=110 /DNA_ID=CAMNT_0021780747 /DNA_START=63 /DNA_END=392 /DNA_ORIENTATION=+